MHHLTIFCGTLFEKRCIKDRGCMSFIVETLMFRLRAVYVPACSSRNSFVATSADGFRESGAEEDIWTQ
jgi:hypothetical protein